MKALGPSRSYDGLILQVRKRGKQQVVTVFTAQQGLLHVFFRAQSRQGVGALLPFSTITFDAVCRDNVLSAQEYACKSNEAMTGLTWERYVYSQVFVEIVLHLLPYGQPDEGAYALAVRYSSFLSRKDPRVVTIIAGWQAAALAGFYPDVEHVRVFSLPDGEKKYYFSDGPCVAMKEVAVPPEVRRLWRTLLQYRWEREETLRLSARGLQVLEQFLYSYVEQYSEKKLQSTALLTT